MQDQRVVWIEWLDSAQFHGWEQNEAVLATLAKEEHECKKCWTIGFVIHESDKTITTAGTVSEHPEQSAGAITIPKVAITKMYDITF